MKRSNSFIALLFCLPFFAAAQPSFDGKARYAVGIYGAVNKPYGDVGKAQNNISAGVNFGYQLSRWLQLNIDAQTGTLKAGDKTDENVYRMEFSNKYASVVLQPKFYFLNTGSVQDNKKQNGARFYKGLYASVGLGINFNNITANPNALPDANYLGDYKKQEFIVPLEAGYTLPVAVLSGDKDVSLNIAYRHNAAFGDEWDGYVPTVPSNQHRDSYSAIILGLKLGF